MLTHERLLEVLDYDPETGVFTWLKPGLRLKRLIGTVAGCDRGDGYVRIYFEGQRYAAHRLAWFYQHGVWPVDLIDHDNTQKNCNQIYNLRETDRSGNAANMKTPVTNTSGFKGVSWSKQKKKWIAVIIARGKSTYLGSFKSIKDAAQAYACGAVKHHGEFGRVA